MVAVVVLVTELELLSLDIDQLDFVGGTKRTSALLPVLI
jgi:hypothetical protein